MEWPWLCLAKVKRQELKTSYTPNWQPSGASRNHHVGAAPAHDVRPRCSTLHYYRNTISTRQCWNSFHYCSDINQALLFLGIPLSFLIIYLLSRRPRRWRNQANVRSSKTLVCTKISLCDSLKFNLHFLSLLNCSSESEPVKGVGIKTRTGRCFKTGISS